MLEWVNICRSLCLVTLGCYIFIYPECFIAKPDCFITFMLPAYFVLITEIRLMVAAHASLLVTNSIKFYFVCIDGGFRNLEQLKHNLPVLILDNYANIS